MSSFELRPYQPGDESGAYNVCYRTGDHGADGFEFFREDPDCLGRVFVGPYFAFEPAHAWVLVDSLGVCGYALGAGDSREFYQRYDTEWRPKLCAEFPMPTGDPASWTRVQHVYSWYHQPDYTCPEPYSEYPSHLHIDLLERAQGQGFGRQMMERVMQSLQKLGTPGVHLGASIRNTRAHGFYRRLGFHELLRTGTATDGCLYMGKRFS